MQKKLLGVAVAAALAVARAIAEPIKQYHDRRLAFYALHQSDTDKGFKPMPISSGSDVIAVREKIVLAANPVAGDILAMLDLPADHMPVDFILDADDLDANGAPTITLDVGILNAAKTDIDVTADSGGGKWLTASNVAQAGGLARPSAKNITRVVPKNVNRKVGVRVAVASATFQAGEVGLTLLLRAAHHGS